MFARFMAFPDHTYLMLKIPRPNGIITIKGSFTLSDNCDREFKKISQSFGMVAEYAKFKDTTNNNVLPEAGRSLPDQAFDSTNDTKEVKVQPNDP
jgi:hypothetical protein